MAEEFHNVSEKRKEFSDLSIGRHEDFDESAYKMSHYDIEKYQREGKVVLPIMRPGHDSMDAYEIPETDPVDYVGLTKRIRVFTKGNDVQEQGVKPPQIIRDLRNIKYAILSRFEEAEMINDMDELSETRFRDKYYASKTHMLKKRYVEEMKHDYERLMKCMDSSEGMPAHMSDSILGIMLRSGITYEVGKQQKALLEIFEALYGMKKHDFWTVFGETKKKVVNKIEDDLFHDIDRMPENEFMLKYNIAKDDMMKKIKPDYFVEGKEGMVRLDSDMIVGVVSGDPVAPRGPEIYAAFLEHYVIRTAEMLRDRIAHAEKINEFEELEEEFGDKWKDNEYLATMWKRMNDERFVEKYAPMSEEMVERLKHGYKMFENSIVDNMLSHSVLSYFKESDAVMLPLGPGYVYKLIKHGGRKCMVGGTERTLLEVFDGLHDMEDEEFVKKFGASKNDVRSAIADELYQIHVPELYKEYENDLRKYVSRMNERELLGRFTRGKKYKEWIGEQTYELAGTERTFTELFEGLHNMEEDEFRNKFGETKLRAVESLAEAYDLDLYELYGKYGKGMGRFLRRLEREVYKKAPDALRAELDSGVEMYMKEVDDVASLFVPEQWELARETIAKEGEALVNPPSAQEKQMAMEDKLTDSWKKLKTEKSGQFIDEAIEARKRHHNTSEEKVCEQS